MEIYIAAFGNVSGLVMINGTEFMISGKQQPIYAGSFDDLQEIRICPLNGKFGDSEDNFLFVYTPTDPKTGNFTLSGDFSAHFGNSSFPHRQSGYGLFAVDTAASGREICRYRNQISVGRFRMDSAFDIGAGMRVITGYTNPDAIEFGSVRKIDTTRTADAGDPGISDGESFRLSLGKTDDGFGGEIISCGKTAALSFPGCDFLTVQDPDRIYMGIAAAGNIDITVEHICFKITPGRISHTPEEAIHSSIPDYPFSRRDLPSRRPVPRSGLPAEIYAAPEGRADNPGTAQSPLDLQTALDSAAPGSRILLKDGIYAPRTSYIAAGKNAETIRIEALHHRKAILDGHALKKRVPLFILSSECWHVSGLTFQNSPSAGLFLCGSRNTVEFCRAHDNQDTGILLCACPGADRKDRPSFNEIIGCESDNNCDPERGNADGFGAKLTTGPGNRFYRCCAHHNIDDGFDLYTKSIFGPIEPVILEDCLSYENGHLSGEPENKRDTGGMGFKLGGENQKVSHTVLDCTAFANDSAGFSTNSNPSSRLSRLTAAGNGKDPARYNYRLVTGRPDIMPDWEITQTGPQTSVLVKAGDRSPVLIGAASLRDFLKDGKTGKDRSELPREPLTSDPENTNLMFIVPRISGGGAEKVITSLASNMAENHRVFLVTTIREDNQETYPVSPKVRCINLYRYGEGEDDLSDFCDIREKNISEKEDAKAGRIEVLKTFAGDKGKVLLNRISRNKKSLLYKLFRRRLIRWEEYQKTHLQVIRLQELKRLCGISCAVSFLNSANYLNVRSDIGEKTIISVRSCLDGPFSPPESRTPEGKLKIRYACRHADHIVAVSKETGSGLAKRFGPDKSRISVIFNYVDIERIYHLSSMPMADPLLSEALEKAGFVFVTSGRLTEKKGQWHLIRAFKEVVRKYPDTILMILGHEGKGKENTAELLRQTITAQELSGKVFLSGFHINPFPWLSRGDAFVLTSFNEGFPNALAEAMAFGLPVISTDCRSGPREILAPDTDWAVKTQKTEFARYGILTPECSGRKDPSAPLEYAEKELAGAMLTLIENDAVRTNYRHRSAERAARFYKNDILAQWGTIIEQA